MTEKNPLTYSYSFGQGRLATLEPQPFDGDWMYVLGHISPLPFELLYGDYIEISQDIDLTGTNFLRSSAKIVQPFIPPGRDVSGHYEEAVWVPTATLKRQHVFTPYKPSTWTRLKGSFYFPHYVYPYWYLTISVDGVDVNASFARDSTYTATEVAEIIDTAVSAVGGEAWAAGTAGDETVYVGSLTTGINGTIEIKEYSELDQDANAYLDFYKKIASASYSDTAFHGGDDCSAIEAPDAAFTADDIGLPLVISGASSPGNNFPNTLAAILSPTEALLRESISDESTGFHAVIPSALWEFSVYVDTWKGLTILLDRNRELLTQDIAINVSKINDTATVRFRYELKAVL